MPVTHTFVSSKPASSDVTLVGSSEWNAAHTISIVNADVAADAAIDESKLNLNNPTHAAVTIGIANGLSLVGQALSITQASTGVTGALSGTDWDTFNGKQSALGYTPLSPANNLSDVANQQTALDSLTNVAAATNEHVLTKDTATGNAIFKAAAGGGVTGSGTTGQLAKWSSASALTDAALIPPATNILTLTNAAASTLALNITAAKTLTLTAVDNYTIVFPASGTVPLLGTANVFTAAQTWKGLGATSDAGITMGKYQYNAGASYPAMNPTANGWIMTQNNIMIGTGGVLRLAVGGTYGNTYSSDLKATTNGNGTNITGRLAVNNATPDASVEAYFKSMTAGCEVVIDGATSTDSAWIYLRAGGVDKLAYGFEPNTDTFSISRYDGGFKQFLTVGRTTNLMTVLGVTGSNSSIKELLRLDVSANSTQVGAAGFGVGQSFYAETATDGTNQQQGLIATAWSDATNATRKADLILSAYDTAAREGIRIRADGSRSLVGLDTAAPTARLHLPAGTATANTAPLKLTAGTNLTTPEDGAIEYDGTSPHFTIGTVRRAITLGNDTQTADQTVANTTTETTVHTSAVVGNEFKAGKMYKVTVLGKFSTANASDTLTLRSKMGGTTILTAVLDAKTVTDEHFRSEFWVTIRTVGVSGTYAAHLETALGSQVENTSPVTGSVDTTAAEDLTLTIQWSSANAGNTITVMQSLLEVIN